MLPVPSNAAALGEVKNGKTFITTVWHSFLQQFTQAPAGVVSLSVSASPYSYEAKEPGTIVLVGGTITALALIRGAVSIDITGQRIIPVSIKDIVRVTYSVLPAVKFLAR